MKLDLESKMHFDYSVGTEDRFALRRWFGQFVEAQNQHDLAAQTAYLSDQLIVKGFTADPLTYAHYLDYLQARLGDGKSWQVRYPEVHVKFKGFLFYISGSFEGYLDGILSYDGSVDLKVAKTDDTFTLVYMEFYPRMMMANQ
jgi:hypothetical protein